MIVIGFSVIYGLISAKSWRVFMIFKNLTTNGKVIYIINKGFSLFIKLYRYTGYTKLKCVLNKQSVFLLFQMTRDEHLLLGLFVMILLDFVVLIPWHLVDPIKCSRKAISEVFEVESDSF